MKTLKDLNKDELKKLYENNHELKMHAWEDAYNQSMDLQYEESNLMHAEVFDYHDHYSSFYLTTPTEYGAKYPERVANKLDADYMTPENQYLYTKLNNLINAWENMTTDEQDEEKGEKIYDQAIEACDKLAEGITEQLRAYEDVSDEQAFEEFKFQAQEGYMSNWTINEKGVVTETIYKTYK